MATPTNLPSSFTTGQVLTAANMNDLRGAFRILQVVSATYATQLSSTSATFADTGLTANITCQSTSSKVLVVYTQNVYTTALNTGVALRIVRGSTTLITDEDYGYSAGGATTENCMNLYMDSPNSVSSLTYKTQFARNQGTGTVYVNTLGTNNTARLLLFEISA